MINPVASETLSAKQCRFCLALCDLIIWAKFKGYDIAFGEASRSDEQAEINALGFDGRTRIIALIGNEFPELAKKIANNGKANGIRGSLHELRLAVDLIVFLKGKYLQTTEEYKELGERWESKGGCWGGRFSDGNHFSFEHEGKK